MWHIVSFRCSAEFNRYRGIADKVRTAGYAFRLCSSSNGKSAAIFILQTWVICPTNPVPLAKIFRFSRRANHLYKLARLPPDQEGRFAIVTDVGRGMRWPRVCVIDETQVSDGEVVWS